MGKVNKRNEALHQASLGSPWCHDSRCICSQRPLPLRASELELHHSSLCCGRQHRRGWVVPLLSRTISRRTLQERSIIGFSKRQQRQCGKRTVRIGSADGRASYWL